MPPSPPPCLSRFVSSCARIWYNFDTLPRTPKSSSPLLTWRQVKALVVASTNSLVAATGKFVTAAQQRQRMLEEQEEQAEGAEAHGTQVVADKDLLRSYKRVLTGLGQ